MRASARVVNAAADGAVYARLSRVTHSGRAGPPLRDGADPPAHRAGRPGMVRHAIEVLVASDPGLTRWRSGARAALTAAASSVVLVPFAQRRHEPAGLVLAGIVVATMAASRIYDDSVPAQRLTMALAIPVALATVAVGSLVASRLWLDQLVFCAVVFAGTFARRYGARGSVLGLLAFMCYFFSLFAHTGANDFTLTAVSIVVSVAIAYVVRFLVVRESPTALLDDLLAAFRARVTSLLDLLSAVASSRRNPGWKRHRVRVGLARLNDAALALEDEAQSRPRGRSAADRWALDVFDVELAVETVAELVARVGRGRASAHQRERLAMEIAALGAAVRADGRSAPRAAGTDAAPLDAGEPLAFAKTMIARSHPWTPPPPADAVLGEATTAAGGSPLGPNPDAAGARRTAIEPALRLAVQAALAAALAMIAGHPVSSARWYWAVVGVFVVFMRSTNREESVSRAWQRILGTIGGVALGVVAAQAVGSNRVAMLGLLLAGVFGALYLSGLSYAWMMVFLTTALALLYDALGNYSSALLRVRLEETVIGAAIGAIVATVLLPAPARPSVRRRAADVLREAARAVQALTSPDAVSMPPRVRLHWARRVDRAVQRFRLATRPAWLINAPLRAPSYMDAVPAATDLAYAVRHLVGRFDAGALSELQAAATAHWLARIAAARSALAAAAGLDTPLAGAAQGADIS